MATRQLNAKLVMCSIPTTNSAAAQQFYNTLLGGDDFARTLNGQIESYYRPISKDGLTLTITARQTDREPLTCFFAVDNLAGTVEQLEAAGGKVVVNSTPVPVSAPELAKQAFAEVVKGQQAPTTAGHFVGMTDPDGNYLGLLQLDSSMQNLLNAQPASRRLSQAQVDQLDNWKQHGDPEMRVTY
jgi:predicted enzyme related to lactoylglutathione lyase